MRTKSSLKNMLFSMISNILTRLMGLVVQTIFLRTLGTEYLGLNGLFSNVISMLGMAELGIGSAIIFKLYKPLSDNDTEKIKALMNFYKKCYRIIATFVFCVGIILIPFLNVFVDIDSVTVDINVYIVYLLFLFDIVISYILSYKRSFLYASQENYIVNIIDVASYLFFTLMQIIVLIFTQNYYFFLILKILLRLVENCISCIVVNKKYPYLVNNHNKLNKKDTKEIFEKIKGLFFHQIGSFVVNGTDNILISKMINIVTVGLYSNYYLIINSVNILFSQIIKATTASVGNLLVTESSEKQFLVFKRIRFANFWIATFTATCVFNVMDSFITLWIGNEYILSKVVLVVLTINLYQSMMRSTYCAFKESAGIFYEDRFVPIIEAVSNIVFSIIFAKMFGLVGIFMGTLVSSLALWLISYPIFVYMKLFKRSYLKYLSETLIYLIMFIVICSMTYFTCNFITSDNILVNFLLKVLFSIIFSNLFLFLFSIKNENFEYYKKFVFSVIKKIKISKIFIKIFDILFRFFKYIKFYKIADIFVHIKDKIILNELKKIGKDIIVDYKDKNINKRNDCVWILWYQGEKNAPNIVKKCINSVKKYYNNVIVLDEKNLSNYIKIDDNILKKFNDGSITKTHFSDIVRMKVLAELGGCWFDATVFLTDYVKEVNSTFFTPKLNPKDILNRFNVSKGKWCGFCIGGYNITLFSFCYDFFVKYWKTNDSLLDYYLIDYVIKIAYDNIEVVHNLIENNNFNNMNIFELESIINDEYNEEKIIELKQKNRIHKLSYKIKIDENNNNNNYYKVIKGEKIENDD